MTSPHPPKDRSRRSWIVGCVVAFVLLICLGLGIALSAGGSGNDTAASPMPQAGAPITSPAPADPADAGWPTPQPADFKLGVKTLKKECFGSAGCVITYRITINATHSADPARTYEVTYEVKGAQDPITNTFEMTGDSASIDQEETAQTKRSSDKLTAVVTSVSEM